jgi:hypothetical protein
VSFRAGDHKQVWGLLTDRLVGAGGAEARGGPGQQGGKEPPQLRSVGKQLVNQVAREERSTSSPPNGLELLTKNTVESPSAMSAIR